MAELTLLVPLPSHSSSCVHVSYKRPKMVLMAGEIFAPTSLKLGMHNLTHGIIWAGSHMFLATPLPIGVGLK